jgi:hypothetical protein
MKKVILLIVLAFSLSTNAQESKLSKTNEVLSKAVEKGIEFAEKTGNFVIEQAPDLLKEFYAWQLYSNISLFVLMLIISYAIYFVSKKIVESAEDEFLYIINLFQILPFVFLLVSGYKIIFITVAPKLYLIEYFIK